MSISLPAGLWPRPAMVRGHSSKSIPDVMISKLHPEIALDHRFLSGLTHTSTSYAEGEIDQFPAELVTGSGTIREVCTNPVGAGGLTTVSTTVT